MGTKTVDAETLGTTTRELDEAQKVPVRFQSVHGYRRAYRSVGEGPALLLLHGIGDSSVSWVPLIPKLAERYTVITPDLLGHGNSSKPRADYSIAAYANGMRDLLDVLDVAKVTVIGHSLGGGIAAQMAYQYPERVERLILVASGGVSRQVTPVLRLLSAPFADLALPMLHWPLARVYGRLALQILRRSGHRLGTDADELTRIFDALPDASARTAFVRTLRSAVDWRGQVITMLDRCYLADAMPVLLMWGTKDGVIPVEHAHLAHSCMPNSRLVIFEGAGHFPHHVDPDRFLAELNTFMDETEPLQHDRERWRQRLRDGGQRLPDVETREVVG
jgi:pimeloyl-ACP methyl ester carboxylesterase